ncbi:MAG: type IV toxin-antitoxin system AbiEi family antitoxin [Elusimicrobia bacterium]|nr:type IV toxin-antitoxin system AbiEi family antitoxin [Elusimicrobiota bacterium]
MAASNPAVAMSHAEQAAYFSLVRAGRSVATPGLLAQLLHVTSPRATLILHQLNKKGAARRVAKGLYAVRAPEAMSGTGQFIQDPLVVAAQIMGLAHREYAAAFLSAAYLHGFLEQTPQAVQMMISHFRRPLRLTQAQVVRFVNVSPWKLFGLVQLRYENEVLMATDPEKTVLDCLDRTDLAGGLEQAAQILAAGAGKLEARKLARYAKRMRNRSLIQRLGYLLDKGRLLPDAAAALWPVQRAVPCPLDPAVPRQGRLNERWLVIENAAVSMRERK